MSDQNLADRMLDLGEQISAETDGRYEALCADPSRETGMSYGRIRWAEGFHVGIEQMREWIEDEGKSTDDLLGEVEGYLNDEENWPLSPEAGDDSTSQPYDPAEYVRLLRVASAALAKARAYGDTRDRWRPAYSDLILLESMDGWTPESDAGLVLNCTPDEAMAKVVEANEGVTLPDQVWEFYDEDAERVLTPIGVLAADEEVDDE